MSEDGWGTSFETPDMNGWPPHVELTGPVVLLKDVVADLKTLTPWELHNGNIKKNNKVPTHDPYANPNAQLYYSCSCGAIFDPGTKRFAELNNAASNAGWKIRFSDTGYVPYCVDCGKGVE